MVASVLSPLPALIRSEPAAASSSAGLPTYVYVNENPAPVNGVAQTNMVAAYSLSASGAVAALTGSPYSSGGLGYDGSYVVAPRTGLTLDMARTSGYLYVLNLGDKPNVTLSVFSINVYTGVLSYKATQSLKDAGGSAISATSIAANAAGTILYTGGSPNALSTPELNAFQINADGTLNPTATSTLTNVIVDGLAVSPDGSMVAAAYPGNSTTVSGYVALFATGCSQGGATCTTSGGGLTSLGQSSQTCPTDVRFSPDSKELYSAACYQGGLTYYPAVGPLTPTGTIPNLNSLRSGQALAVGLDGTVYYQDANGNLASAQLVSGVLTPNGSAAYAGTSSITTLDVSPDDANLFVGSFQSATLLDYQITAGGGLVYAQSLSGISPGLPTAVSFVSQCPGVNSVCIDQQSLEATVPPGTLTITTPYTASAPFVLPSPTLSPDGTFLQTSATFPAGSLPSAQQIVVTSSLAGDPGWTLSVAASNLTDGTGGVIPASGLGFTGATLIGASCVPGAPPVTSVCSHTSSFPGRVSFTDLAAHNPGIPTSPPGLSPAPQSMATSTAGDGSALIDGTLTLLVPTSTPAGTYTGTITFSAI